MSHSAIRTPDQQHNVARTRDRDTKPELAIRQGLWARGFRHRLGFNYRRHGKFVQGKPDLVYPRRHAVVFVHGCYFHHHNCDLGTMPKRNVRFWKKKFQDNKTRDRKNIEELLKERWRVLVIWECAMRTKGKKSCGVALEETLRQSAKWLNSNADFSEISSIHTHETL